MDRMSITDLQKRQNALLGTEFCLLFIGVPTLCCLRAFHAYPMQMLWSVSGFCLIVLLGDQDFEFSRFWRVPRWKKHVPWAALRFAALASVLTLCSVVFLRISITCSHIQGNSPLGFTLFSYPILSVYPQGIVYRGFLFHRYRNLFPDRRLLILASALVFGYGHVIYAEPATVGLTMVGGLLFAWTYSATGSLIVSWVEHTLYGDFLFVIGLWKYFFHLAG
jgi:membrane protease YdiL (CAAX protease family)